MTRRRCRAVLTEGIRQHPAVKAWTAVTSLDTAPECIHVRSEHRPTAVYWLPGLGEGGTGVFAKRSLVSRIMIERTVYERILPRLPLEAPHYYGTHVEKPYGWIFVEDVGDERYSKTDPAHLALAARWVGTLHASATRIAAARSLPDAGTGRYLRHLRTGREEIWRSLRIWHFTPSEVAILMKVVSCCDRIEARWHAVEAACQGAPSTVVHGDFRPKNAILRRNGNGLSLCPIDWETAGFGPPAVDLTRIDLRTYCSVVRRAWPDVTLDTLERLEKGGRVLQWLAAIDWGSTFLNVDIAARRRDAVTNLELVVYRLTDAAHSAGVLV